MVTFCSKYKPVSLRAYRALHNVASAISLTSSPSFLPLVTNWAHSKLGSCTISFLSLDVHSPECHMGDPLTIFMLLLKLSQQGLSYIFYFRFNLSPNTSQTPDSLCPALIFSLFITLSFFNIPCS